MTITKEASFDFNASNGEVLDSILIRAGEMIFQMNSTFPADISITIDIPSLKISGSDFQQGFTFNGPGAQNPSFDLGSATLDLVNGGTANSVSFSVTAVITDTGQPIDNSHSMDFNFGLNDLQFRGMFGDLGSPALTFSADSIDVDVFDNAFGGTVELLAPAVYLTMKNSFGIPIGFDIESISASKSGAVMELDGSAVDSPANPYRLDAPSYDQIGETVSSQVALTPTSSNLPELISSLPAYFSYRFGLELNPAPVSSKNFVMDDSKLTIGVRVELPFYGRISGISITKQFDFGGLGIDDVEESFIRLKTVNELPLDVDLQVYFSDADGTVLDSLFTDPSVIKGADVDSDAFTQGSEEVVRDVSVTQAKVDRIEQAELLILKATMSTTDGGAVPVKFSVDDKIRISLGVNTRVSFELN